MSGTAPLSVASATAPVAVSPVRQVIQGGSIIQGGSRIIQGGSIIQGGYQGLQQGSIIQGQSINGSVQSMYAQQPMYQQPMYNQYSAGVTGYASVAAPTFSSVAAPLGSTAGSVSAPPGFAPIIQPVSASASAPLTFSMAAPSYGAMLGGINPYQNYGQAFGSTAAPVMSSASAPVMSSVTAPSTMSAQAPATMSVQAPMTFGTAAAGPFQALAPIQSSSIRYAAPAGWGGAGSVTVPHAGSVVVPM